MSKDELELLFSQINRLRIYLEQLREIQDKLTDLPIIDRELCIDFYENTFDMIEDEYCRVETKLEESESKIWKNKLKKN